MLVALFRLQRYKIKCIYARVEAKKCTFILILVTIYLLTLCIILLAADGVGPRNVVGSKLLKLLIFIFFCREQCWRSMKNIDNVR